MLANIRRKIREIEYYSATRPRSRWSRAANLTPLLAVVLAWPVVWLMDHMVHLPRTTVSLHGHVYRQVDGPFTAELVDDPAMRPINIPGGRSGTFTIEFSVQPTGVPVPTSTIVHPPTAMMEISGEPLPRLQVTYSPDDPILVAVAAAVNQRRYAGTPLDFRQTALQQYRRPGAWLINSVLWWLILSLIGMALVSVLRFAHLSQQRRRYLRRRTLEYSNKCGQCGYDLTGLEFNERCPECGGLIHATTPMPPY